MHLPSLAAKLLSPFELPSFLVLPDPLEDAADDEKVVEHGEDDEQSIENEAVHLLRTQDRDGHGLRQKHITCNFCKKFNRFF